MATTTTTTSTTTDRLPRGLRNNNPLNLRRTKTRWQGETVSAQHPDMAFCQFEDLSMGWRAAWITLHVYYYRHRLRTLRQIIKRWAPPTDGNDTQAYIDRVCQLTNIAPDEVLPPIEQFSLEWFSILPAMAVVENGPRFEERRRASIVYKGWLLMREYYKYSDNKEQ